MSSHKIRTTLEPEREIEVGDAELLDLQRNGLVLDTTAKTGDGARKAAARQVADSAEKSTG